MPGPACWQYSRSAVGVTHSPYSPLPKFWMFLGECEGGYCNKQHLPRHFPDRYQAIEMHAGVAYIDQGGEKFSSHNGAKEKVPHPSSFRMTKPQLDIFGTYRHRGTALSSAEGSAEEKNVDVAHLSPAIYGAVINPRYPAWALHCSPRCSLVATHSWPPCAGFWMEPAGRGPAGSCKKQKVELTTESIRAAECKDGQSAWLEAAPPL